MGFTDKEIHLIFIIAVTVIGGFVISRILKIILKRVFSRSAELIKVDPTNYKFFFHTFDLLFLTAIIIIVFWQIPELKEVGMTLFAGAGILTVIIGFASQQAFSNIVGGVFIVIFKPFRVGDWVKIGEFVGEVEDINLRHTVINNPENRRIVIPNSVVSSETILNSHITDPKICNHLEIGISYDSDIDKAWSIIREEAEKHKDYIDNRTDEQKAEGEPAILIRLIGFGDSSVNLRAYIWSENSADGFAMLCDLRKSVKERFDKEGIEIPFPYRTIVYKGKENG